MKAEARWLMRVVPWLLLGGIGIWGFAGGWKGLERQLFERKAQGMFANVGGVTEARVYLLRGSKARRTGEVFPIRPYGTDAPVHGSVTLKGKELAAFLDLWRGQSVSIDDQALCHDPVYGFRLYRGGKLMGETSVCWHCSNFYVDVSPSESVWCGFDADSEAAKGLLGYCDRLLPYDRGREVSSEGKGE